MNFSKLLENFSVALVAQTVSMLVSIATVILAPKVMNVNQYGYWQLYIFYVGYVNLFNLGINDGVYLLNGGKSREDIDKRNIASQFWFSIAYQFAMVMAALPVIVCVNVEADRVFVLLSLLVSLLICNASSYVGYVFQALNETKEYSKSIIVDRGVLFVGLCMMLVIGVESFEPYVVVFIASKACALAYCLNKGHDFIFSRPLNFVETSHCAWKSIKVGSQLLIAVNAGTLVIGVARFIIDASCSIEVFGMVSFSLSIVNFIMAFVGQVAMVLFPALRQCLPNELKNYFTKGRELLSAVLPIALVLYWPACVFVDVWLPEYQNALHYMALLAPLCIFEGRMSILCTTFFKVLRMETALLAVNLVTLAACVCGCLIVTAMGMSVEAVLLVVLVVVAIRCIGSEFLVSHHINISIHASVVCDIMPTLVFLCACNILSFPVACAVYVAFLSVFIMYNRHVFVNIVKLGSRFR